MRRRALLATVAGGVTLLPGCGASDDTGTDSTTGSDTTVDRTTAARTTTEPPTDGDLSGIDETRNTPVASLFVALRNDDDQSHTIQLTVARDADDEVVHDQSYTLDPGGVDGYELGDDDPDNVEGFTLTARMDGQQTGMFLRTSECYVSPEISVGPDGSLLSRVAIC